MPVVPDQTAASSAKHVVLVSGRLYYDLVDRRNALDLESNVAIVRVEQLYPLPTEEIQAELAKYPNRSEEHTSELQSRGHLSCRLLLEKKNDSAKSPAAGSAPRPGRS